MAIKEVKTKVLVHVDTSVEVGDVINGELIMLPVNEPVELDPFIADAILSHIGDVHGIVEVEQVKTKTGVEWKIEEGLEYAEKKLAACEQRAIDFYVRQQMEDRIAAGKPALPPNGRVLKIVLARGISLRDEYGIVPVGWKDVNASKPNTGEAAPVADTAAQTAAQAVITAQQATIAEMQAQIAAQAQQMAALMQQMQGLVATLNGESETTATE